MIDGYYVGDIVGSAYAHEYQDNNTKTTNFELFTPRSKFTDETILTTATMEWLMQPHKNFTNLISIFKTYMKKYPQTKPEIYGEFFAGWIATNPKTPNASFGNGGAMRAGVLGWYAKDVQELKGLITSAIMPTHNTPEALDASYMVAKCVFDLKQGASKQELIAKNETEFGFSLQQLWEQGLKFSFAPQMAIYTVQLALLAFLQSKDFEQGLRKVVSYGYDADTTASIYATIAESYEKGIDERIVTKAKKYMPQELLQVHDKFVEYLLSIKRIFEN